MTADRHLAKEKLIEDWAGRGIERPNENLILAARNVDAVALNREAQARRLENGFLSEEKITVAGEELRSGDRIVFTRNNKSMGVKNGQLATVECLAPTLNTLTVQLDSGRSRTFSTGDYDSVKLGYAVTTHKAQGMTAQNAYILTDESMQDRELSYVQASRAKDSTRIYTTQVEAGEAMADLARRMEKSREKELAMAQAVRAEAPKAQEHELALWRK